MPGCPPPCAVVWPLKVVPKFSLHPTFIPGHHMSNKYMSTLEMEPLTPDEQKAGEIPFKPSKNSENLTTKINLVAWD